MDLKLRCSAASCDCKSFSPAGDSAESLRICDSCNHTWITHLLEKLLTATDDQLSVFDVCSLCLYGTHALPIRIKIVVERLLTTLGSEEIEKIRKNFGWTLQDLARGYMVQDPRGGIINRWSLLPPEEELIILQQFLRFPITRPISVALIKEDFPNNNILGSLNSSNSLNIINNNIIKQKQSGLGHPSPPSHPMKNSNFSPSLPTSGQIKMRSTSPRDSSALNLSISQASSDSSSNSPCHDRDHRDRECWNYLERERIKIRQDLFSHSYNVDSPVMDLSLNKKEAPVHPGHSAFAAANMNILKSRGMTVSQALKSVRQASTSPKVGQNPPPPSFEDSVVGGLMAGMNMSSLLSNLGNIKSTDLMAAAAAQQFLSSVTASLQKKSHQHQQQHRSGSISPGIVNHGHQHPPNGNVFHNQQVSIKTDVKQEPQQHSPNNNNNSTPTTPTSLGTTQKKTKRPWNPLPPPVAMATHLVNPATGKRRVQCAVCMKTFCDKGALKIHFSAVHLREMHKCTVAGCSMMFSSRRSRNRHSANPNPKLHSPHVRRKISPHDGRTAGPVLNLNSPTLMLPPGMRYPPFLTAGGSPNNLLLGGSGPDGGSPQEDEDSLDEKMQINDDGVILSYNGEDYEGKIGSVKEEYMSEEDGDGDGGSLSSTNEDSSSLLSHQKFSPEQGNTENGVGGCGGAGGMGGGGNGARKRKRTHPVRLPSVPDDSADEFCCYDDGTPSHQVYEQHNSNTNAKGSPAEKREEEVEVEEGEKPLDVDFHKKTENHLEKLQNLPMFTESGEEEEEEEENSEEKSDEENDGSPTNGYIPIDKDNPRKCSACGKEFQNQFGVKNHYQNVHLKLMHKCSVDGCTASFPSKRSRDRHSSNLNLHRKLLSTSPSSPRSRSRSPASRPSSTGSNNNNNTGGSIHHHHHHLLHHHGHHGGGALEFLGAASNAAVAVGTPVGLSILNPYMYRGRNLMMENSLYIN